MFARILRFTGVWGPVSCPPTWEEFSTQFLPVIGPGVFLYFVQSLFPPLFHESFHLAAATRYLQPGQYRLAPNGRAVYVERAPRWAYLHILLWPVAFWFAVGVSLYLLVGAASLFFTLFQMLPSGMDFAYAWIVFRNPTATHITYDGSSLILWRSRPNDGEQP